jgi:hypothetical protein
MRVKLKESNVSNLIRPRRGFLVGLASLLAAPAVVKAENLMPIKVRPPPLIWRDGKRRIGLEDRAQALGKAVARHQCNARALPAVPV